ncbi:MAG: bifunctional adenosylcobinamide kinase/adenosylcobinamide-phosphate guanylyltransferase [Faecalibacterium sp.]
MIFITGGMAQGKTSFAASFGLPVLDNLAQQIKGWLAQGLDVDTALSAARAQLCERTAQSDTDTVSSDTAAQDCVIICDEIGCGIVPLAKEERIWREVTGRTACRLAQEATAVYKLEAGIPIRLK